MHAYCYSKLCTASPGSPFPHLNVNRAAKVVESRKTIFFPSSLNEGEGGRPGMDLQGALRTYKQCEQACAVFGEHLYRAVGMACDAEGSTLHSSNRHHVPQLHLPFRMAVPLLMNWRFEAKVFLVFQKRCLQRSAGLQSFQLWRPLGACPTTELFGASETCSFAIATCLNFALADCIIHNVR